MAKKFEELTISDDFMFCVVMQNSRFCKKFLETILGVKIARIEYPDAQKTINITPDAKSVRLDVYLEDDQDTVYDIEMQNAPKPNLPKRMRYYQGMMDLNLLNKGEDYTELKKSYVIFVCTFDPFMQGRHIYTFENLCKEDTNLALGDDTKKVILNTLKINISMCLIGVIMGEFLTSKAGIGYLILYGSQIFNLDLVMTGIFLLIIISIVMYELIIFITKE